MWDTVRSWGRIRDRTPLEQTNVDSLEKHSSLSQRKISDLQFAGYSNDLLRCDPLGESPDPTDLHQPLMSVNATSFTATTRIGITASSDVWPINQCIIYQTTDLLRNI